MLVGFSDSGKTIGNLGNGLFTIAQLAARFGQLAGDRSLHTFVIMLDASRNGFIHLINFVLRAFVLAVDFVIERARKIGIQTHGNNHHHKHCNNYGDD